ncbi:MAG: hypothetical protein ACFE8G_14760 [Candidatus Hermodarchaeota archaeon]
MSIPMKDKFKIASIFGFIISLFALIIALFLLLPMWLPIVFYLILGAFLFFSTALIGLSLAKRGKDSIKASIINIFKNRKSILIPLNIGLMIAIFVLYVIVRDPDVSGEIYQNLFPVSIILGWVIATEFIGLSIFMGIKSIAKIKKIALSGSQSEVASKIRWSSFFIFLLLCFGFFFISLESMGFLPIIPTSGEQVSHSSLVILGILPSIVVAIFFSFCIVYSYHSTVKKNLIPRLNELIRFRDLVKNRDRIRVKELQAFYSSDKDFYDKMLRWVQKFNFILEGDTIILNKENLNDFIIELDNEYKKWQSQEKKKGFKKI